MFNPLLKRTKFTRVNNAAAAGTSAVNSASVDMAGFDGVTFTALLGTLTATQVTSLGLEESDDNSTFTAVTSGATAAMADGDSNKMLVADYYRPAKRYVRVTLARATANAVLDGIVAMQYASRTDPTSQPTSVSKSVSVCPGA